MKVPFIQEEDCHDNQGCEKVQVEMNRYLEAAKARVFNVEAQNFALMNAIKRALRNRKLIAPLEKLFDSQDIPQICEYIRANLARMKAAQFQSQNEGMDVLFKCSDEQPVYMATRADYVAFKQRRASQKMM